MLQSCNLHDIWCLAALGAISVDKRLEKEDPVRLSLDHSLAAIDGRIDKAINILEHVVAIKKDTLVEDD